jgi:hypothetical protein
MTPFIPFLIVTSLYEVFIEWMEYDDNCHTYAHCDLTDRSIYCGDGVRWYLSYLCSLWPHWPKYLLRGWSMMTPFTPFLIVTSLTEVFIEGMEYDDTFHTFFSLRPYCRNYLLRGRSTMTHVIPVLIVTSLYEVFIEGIEYDETFHTSGRCDLTYRSIYWGEGVRSHLSNLLSLWPHCMKYLLSVWSTMTPFILVLIVTSLTEVFIEGMEYDDTFHTFFSLWPYCMNYLLRRRSTMTPFIPVLIVTLLTEVFIERMEYDDTFHTFSHCDLTDWSIYWEDGVQWHLSHLCSLWPHCMKYLLSGWSAMTPFIPLLIVTSLYEVFIEMMEYDNTLHTSAHCDLTVWSICWRDGVWWHISYFCSLWPHCMKYVLRWWSMITPCIPLRIVTSLYEVIIEGMEYDDIFHTSAHCDLIVWSMYWDDGVW